MDAPTYLEAQESFRWDQVLQLLDWPLDGPVNLGSTIIDRHADGDATAVVWVSKDGNEERLTYRQLARDSDRFANLLKRLGVEKGDRLAGYMPRTPETLTIMLGAFKVGAIYVPLFTGFGSDAIMFRVLDSGAKYLVTHSSVRSRISKEVPAQVICVAEHKSDLHLQDLDFHEEIGKESASFKPVQCSRDDIAAILYTSGSTGKPKGGAIAVNFLSAIWPYASYGLDLRAGDHFWATGDPAWGYGFACYWVALAGGATLHVLEGNPTPEVFVSTIDRYQIANVATTPTLLRGLMSATQGGVKPTGTSLRVLASCGEPLNDEVVEYFRREWDLVPLDHFGATEYGLPIGNYPTISMDVKPGSMGVACPGTTMAIVDEHGRELPAGEDGMIGKKFDSDTLYWSKYWNDKTATRKLVRNGWIVTGDLASRDDEGYFWFRGRTDDMIKSSGYRIGPFEIESALLIHAAVAEAGVVGVPDEMKGQIVKAFVVLKEGVEGTEDLSQELATFVKSRVGKHQYPREIEFVQALPKTTTGKIQRYLLRKTG